MNKIRNIKGFTLIEVMLVITIMTIVTSFALLKYNKAVLNNQRRIAAINLKSIYLADRVFFAKYGHHFNTGGFSSYTLNNPDPTLNINKKLGLNIQPLGTSAPVEGQFNDIACPPQGLFPTKYTCTASFKDSPSTACFITEDFPHTPLLGIGCPG